MKKIAVLLSLFCICNFCLAQEHQQFNNSDARRPNIVFILADDLTRFDIGTYGSENAITPTIDKLTRQGMKFTNAHQAVSMCSPTRHNLYTGLYPTKSGAYPNHTHVYEGVKSVVQYLRPLGYRVALSGKRHIGPKKVFDFEYLDQSLDPNFDKVESFIKDATNGNKPFCLFLNSNQPHRPWNKGDRSLFNKEALKLPPVLADTKTTRKSYRNYLAEIKYLDGQVDRALQLLKKYDISKNTLVIFASEQGNSFPFAKWTNYNAGLGSALIARWPGVIEPGSVTDALVEYSDILPTFIDIAGGKPVKKLDGSSLMPVFTGKKSEHKDYSYGMMTTRGIYSGNDYFPIRSITDGKYRYILNLAPEVRFSNIVIHNGHDFWESWERVADQNNKAARLIRKYRNRPREELYNDNKDPYNLNNLADKEKYQDVKRRLKRKLQEWMQKVGDHGIYTELQAFERQGSHNANGDGVTLHYRMHNPRPGKVANSDHQYKLFNTGGCRFSQFKNTEPVKQGKMNKIRIPPSRESAESSYGVIYRHTVKAPKDGYYSFYAKTGQKARVFVDNKRIIEVENDTRHFGRYGIIGLKEGKHTLKVKYLNQGQKDQLTVQWSGPGFFRQKL